jgi:hypothetical protein
VNYALSIVRGAATPEELAALTATLVAGRAAAQPTAETQPNAPRSTWRGQATWRRP